MTDATSGDVTYWSVTKEAITFAWNEGGIPRALVVALTVLSLLFVAIAVKGALTLV